MKILHFILGKASKERANGVNQVVAGLAKYSARLGAEVRVIGKAQSVAQEGERIPRAGFAVEAYSEWRGPLRSAVSAGIQWADIIHLHGVYSPLNLRVGRMCKEIGRPYVVTLHNGLSPELTRAHGWFRKKLFHALLQRRHLERAAALHVLTEEEATDVFSVVRPQNVFCISNGVDLEDYPALEQRAKVPSAQINIGFLGRLSAEKNLDALCRAFSRVNAGGNMHLKLAGPLSEYGRSLQARYPNAGIELVGPVYGPDKAEFIRDLDLFIVPSLAEGFSIAVAESLALGTPLLVTRSSKMAHFFDQRAFFMCEPTVFGLERGLQAAIDRRNEWPIMAENGRRLIEDRLNWHAVAKDMLGAYGTIAGLGQ